MVRNSLILISVLFLSLNSYGQNISATASTDTTDYLVGDYIHLSVKVKHDKGIGVYNPFTKDVFGKLELIKIEDPVISEENGKQIVDYRYTVSAYDSSNISIPAIPVGYHVGNDTTTLITYTNPLNFTVHTLPVKAESEIKDVKEPIRIPLDWRLILLYLLIALVVIAIARYLYLRHKKKLEEQNKQVKRSPKIPSYLTALNSLHELEEQKLWQKGYVKEYHSTITEIVRRYFEDRFYLPALELTTDEALGKLRNRNDAKEILQITEEFLNNADLVKFAKYKPIASANDEMMKQAYQIVEKTIPKDKEEKKEVISDAE
jgi:hypothetical protein